MIEDIFDIVRINTGIHIKGKDLLFIIEDPLVEYFFVFVCLGKQFEQFQKYTFIHVVLFEVGE